MIWWIVYAVTVVIAYTLIRVLFDGDDEDAELSTLFLYWIMSAVWPIVLVGFFAIELVCFVLRQFDRFLFWIKDCVEDRIEASRRKREERSE